MKHLTKQRKHEMSVYIVTWNLNKERSNYDQARKDFLKQLDTYENIADPGLESVRFLSTQHSADQISGVLRQKLDNNDRLFVSKVRTGEHQGWLAQNVWDWINKRL
jgi:hypothetical protein